MKIITQNTQLQILFFCLLFCSTTAFAQVGIGNNNPQSVLDISSSNQTAPSNTDGLLIPRINNFPAANPGAAQDGMLVFVTGSGTPARGFYYWQQSTTSWIPFGGSSSIDWRLGGNTITNVNTEYIGTNSNHDFRLRTNGIERFNFSSTGELRSYGNGSSGSPVYSWNADTNTGMYRINNDILGLSTAGVERMRIEANGTAVFNETGLATSDFRIESDNLQDMFFVDASANRIGINTNTPAYQFEIRNNGNIGATSLAQNTNNGTNGVASSAINFGTANGYNGIEGATYGNYSGVFGLGFSQDNGGSFDANGVYGHANDYQGIGVYGVRANAGGPDNGFGGLFVNDLGYTGGLFLVSDLRTKKDVTSLPNALESIKKMNPVKYHYDLQKYPYLGLNSKQEFGFVAQEIERILPNLVEEKVLDVNAGMQKGINEEYKSKNEQFKMVNYIQIIPILTQGIKEQQQIIESQNDKIKSLEKKLADLEAKVNSLLEN